MMLAELGGGDVERIRAEPILVGVELHTAEPSGVPDAQLATLGEPEDQAIPRELLPVAAVLEVLHAGDAVDEQPPRHAKAQSHRGAVAGVEQQELAAPRIALTVRPVTARRNAADVSPAFRYHASGAPTREIVRPTVRSAARR